MMAVEYLKPSLSILRISMASGIPRSSIYYREKPRKERRSRVPDSVEMEILRISSERITYGYRRIWGAAHNHTRPVTEGVINGKI